MSESTPDRNWPGERFHRLDGKAAYEAPPPANPRNHAGVAIVAAPVANSFEILFIERAQRAGDHWSGDVAFPGGRFQPGDASIEATARRETHEEVGIVLPPPIARLDDFDSRLARRDFEIVVTPFVYVLDQKPPLVLSSEVASAAWIAVDRLVDPACRHEHCYRQGQGLVKVPALRHERYLIWGMTYRMLGVFLAAAELGTNGDE
jgi:8-oxo-dGTP pyrophosphatase MutT (NUDIX family)